MEVAHACTHARTHSILSSCTPNTRLKNLLHLHFTSTHFTQLSISLTSCSQYYFLHLYFERCSELKEHLTFLIKR
jgi:hypothetical protein